MWAFSAFLSVSINVGRCQVRVKLRVGTPSLRARLRRAGKGEWGVNKASQLALKVFEICQWRKNQSYGHFAGLSHVSLCNINAEKYQCKKHNLDINTVEGIKRAKEKLDSDPRLCKNLRKKLGTFNGESNLRRKINYLYRFIKAEEDLLQKQYERERKSLELKEQKIKRKEDWFIKQLKEFKREPEEIKVISFCENITIITQEANELKEIFFDVFCFSQIKHKVFANPKMQRLL